MSTNLYTLLHRFRRRSIYYCLKCEIENCKFNTIIYYTFKIYNDVLTHFKYLLIIQQTVVKINTIIAGKGEITL